MTTTAKVRAKGLASTGVTEDLAAKMFNTKGARYLAIVELKVDEVHEKSDGDRRVDLVIAELEPVVDGDLNGQLDERVRDIWKALYENRLRTNGGPDNELPLEPDSGPAPAVKDIIQQGQAFVGSDDEGPLDHAAPDEDSEHEEMFDDQDEPSATVPDPFAATT